MSGPKTGTPGRPWVEIESPKPPRVADSYDYWIERPPELSERCLYWLRQIEVGWLPNRRVRIENYDTSAHWYGVWIWEYQNLIEPAITRRWNAGVE